MGPEVMFEYPEIKAVLNKNSGALNFEFTSVPSMP